jgi:subtilase family serine protease
MLSAVGLLAGSVVLLLSQTTGRELIYQRVNEGKLVTLAGNTRPETSTGTDLGEVADSLALDHMMLQLKRSPQQELEVEAFIAGLQNPASPNFHKWLSAAEFGQKFGVAQADIQAITDWLKSHGFTVNSVYPSKILVDFSGNAGQVRMAFHTSIHNLDVDGEHHIANMADPQIPEALAPVVAGVLSLHDFRPHRMVRAKRQRSGAQYTFTDQSGQVQEALVPADLATIYDFNPLFAKGTTGKGQTIVVIEDTDLYRTSDWTTFRSAMGLSKYTSGSLSTVQPSPAKAINNCADPGVNLNGDDIEAALDVEWASAAAPGATIELAACADSGVTSGLFIAAQNAINSSPAPAIVSISYGQCEAENGASSNAAFNSLFQQAVTEGTSVFISAGDEGAASCDANTAAATHGIGVSAFASTPYNVAVGGTDFSDTFSNTSGTYWNLSANTTTYESALSYVPEIPWNDSCASSLTATYNGYSSPYGATGFCGSNAAIQGGYLTVGGGSGGPSGCATGNPSIYGVVSGTCKGFAKPSWQTGLSGIPNDGVRDIPDVSMFASNGVWGHFLVFCFSDLGNQGAPCRGAPLNWSGAGGTSFAAPIMAGVQALINQTVGGPQGNPNPIYYAMAAKVPSAFHVTPQGDIDVNCEGARNCFGYAGTLDYGRGGRIFGTTYGGVLSTSNTSYAPAYAATGSAWNFATGLGSVDVNNLVTNWGAK